MAVARRLGIEDVHGEVDALAMSLSCASIAVNAPSLLHARSTRGVRVSDIGRPGFPPVRGEHGASECCGPGAVRRPRVRGPTASLEKR